MKSRKPPARRVVRLNLTIPDRVFTIGEKERKAIDRFFAMREEQGIEPSARDVDFLDARSKGITYQKLWEHVHADGWLDVPLEAAEALKGMKLDVIAGRAGFARFLEGCNLPREFLDAVCLWAQGRWWDARLDAGALLLEIAQKLAGTKAAPLGPSFIARAGQIARGVFDGALGETVLRGMRENHAREKEKRRVDPNIRAHALKQFEALRAAFPDAKVEEIEEKIGRKLHKHARTIRRYRTGK